MAEKGEINMNREKVFITGATGMLGATLAKELFNQRYKVRILVRKADHPYLKEVDCERIQGDLLDKESLIKGMEGIDYVFHCAAVISYNRADKDMLYKVNVLGTRNVVDAAIQNKIKRLVHVSSTAAVGICKAIKENPLQEKCIFSEEYKKIPYMNTKKLSEKEVRKGIQKGLDAVIVNPSTIIGGGDIKMNSGALFQNIKGGLVKFATPGGNSFVSVKDSVYGMILTMKRGKTGERYILNTENFTFLEMFNGIAKELGSSRISKVIPSFTYYPLCFITFLIEYFKKDLKLTPQVLFFSFQYRYFNSEKAKVELGWKPKQDFHESVKEAIAFYKKNHLL